MDDYSLKLEENLSSPKFDPGIYLGLDCDEATFSHSLRLGRLPKNIINNQNRQRKLQGRQKTFQFQIKL